MAFGYFIIQRHKTFLNIARQRTPMLTNELQLLLSVPVKVPKSNKNTLYIMKYSRAWNWSMVHGHG
jgi:hypothetical protein